MMTIAAHTCAITKPMTSAGSIPTNVFVKLRAKVTAGLAKNVDEVNQYPAVTVRATNIGVLDFSPRSLMLITESKINAVSYTHLTLPTKA